MKATNPDLPVHHYMCLPERVTACGYKGPFGTRKGEHWYSWYVDSTDCYKCLEIGWPFSHRFKEVQAETKINKAIEHATKACWEKN